MVMKAPDAVFGAAVSPDGQRLATDGSTLRRVNLGSGEVDELTGHGSTIARTRFAPDGQSFLSVSYDGTVRVWDPRKSESIRVFTGHNGGVRDAEYVGAGDRIVSAGDDGRVLAWTIEGDDAAVLLKHAAPLETLEVLAYSKHIVVHDSDGVVLDIAPDGVVKRITEKSTDAITLLRASVDGRRVAIGRASGAVTVHDTADYHILQELSVGASVHQIQIDPKNRDLLVQSDAGTVRVVALGQSRTLPWRELVTRARDVAYSPDGETLAFVCADGETWFYSAGRDAWAFARDHALAPLSGRFSPDGKMFVTADSTGAVVVRDVARSHSEENAR